MLLAISKDAAVQQHARFQQVTLITPTAAMSASVHGGRAKCLQRLIRLDMPVPRTVALSFDAVHSIARGAGPAVSEILSHFGDAPLLSVRPSSQDPDWGGPGAILNLGMCEARYSQLVRDVGEEAASALYLRFIQSYATHVAHLDADIFDPTATPDAHAIRAALSTYEDEMEAAFPQDVETQLTHVLRSMARAWEGTSARLLRQAKGAPADAGLGLVVQELALGVGQGESGSGVIQFVDPDTGQAQVRGRYLSQSQGRDALTAAQGAIYLTRDPRGSSLEELCPDAFRQLIAYGEIVRQRLREEMQIEFTIENGDLHILDGVRVQRSSRASVRIAVALSEDGIIPREEAVMRVEPKALSELLHRQVNPSARRDRIVSGIAASPGAASGRIVFSAEAAQAGAARDEACILVRRETTPEDIRGMHAAEAVLTVRGGITSHAAVIGRGLGLPCVVGASDLGIDRRRKILTAPGGRVFAEGDIITVDGTSGDVLAGEAPLLEAALDDAFRTLLGWADKFRDIGVRANADTPADAQTARNFEAEGIGLCRTEHMFFEGERIGLMREMIFADTAQDRRAVLERLMPMQRKDFTALFEIMRGSPVCIRLFDPPLHEFLPSDREGLRELAERLGKPLSEVTARVEMLGEYNPMLGLRGVRLGVTVPEIYEMQARAIFQAAVFSAELGDPVVPEIMIPLVSAMREVELVKASVDSIAATVRSETGVDFDYRLGVMVETPRAALRAADIAQHASFLSFGTNDLTQMTYGLSRDDAGRFMSAYVQRGVYPEDPFLTLDIDGVGELLRIGAERGRLGREDITIGLCGEHGGSRTAIDFCRKNGFDYVSCSPFRVPVARLSAAQLALSDALGSQK
ncbi:pyruvate, phosphate dikinase [Ponticoccus sp. SC2-23]|uniref:putative PEP-binding protein n=1 Tax=Alexandriicola marinus TaxID=2081710 RepID=UPI000FD9FBA1|nr:putative PEP-binding protein [Alexandriicola marinus]MBM1221043.1 pyruvate, phosphate dikinase [Ponticoccus sp. SC6-9]MBM1225613.1 pyruvate, phosphate dikinase [Ponticoccus sp. SC6-15]MBM1227765.1 pyruvate, phosphate dikinase [Ponticoccus sp. SC6-38]MBM1234597.1 pyruvate, phosphate dikinase [Ponticoccus sp. SC6-45]MBM1238267.1 pyruvate, phosphate dikinase [Ponticoccus sp. SC6-49]MBM1243536.1 pyruvate, phosphate dikinase [Ponticoccus sp. SC2-64]MBM1248121.1 pyruvate, phosphate dikinase [Po